MSIIEDGGTAFPTSTQISQNNTTGETTAYQYLSDGMSLRDYFAAKALQASYGELYKYDQFKQCAKAAYEMADIMIEARKHTYTKGEQS